MEVYEYDPLRRLENASERIVKEGKVCNLLIDFRRFRGALGGLSEVF